MASREVGTGTPDAAEAVVLVVDDEPDVASVTATYLERHLDDVAVLVEPGGTDAIDRVGPSIDCVVSDYEMPELDGLTLLRRIRARHPDLPFILFTARGSEEIASEAISAGVTDYLQKGIGTDQYEVLANRVENAIVRRQTEEVAAETETRYQRLLASSPHAVGVHDGSTILFANERLCEIAGVDSESEMLDAELLAFVHEDDRESIANRVRGVVSGDTLQSWSQWRLVRRDGTVRHVESRAAPVRFEGQDASQFVLRDVTERHRHERRIRALHDATRRLVTAEEPGAVAEVTLATVEDVFEEPVAALWAFDPAAGALVPIRATDRANRLVRAEDTLPEELTLPPSSIEMDVFEGGDQCVIENYGDRPDAAVTSLETVLMHPLERHGLLTIASTDPERTFADAERDLTAILARSVTAALARVGASTGRD